MSKNIKITTITAEQRFDAEKPRYNAYQGGHGAHKCAKIYKRTKKHRYQEEG